MVNSVVETYGDDIKLECPKCPKEFFELGDKDVFKNIFKHFCSRCQYSFCPHCKLEGGHKPETC